MKKFLIIIFLSLFGLVKAQSLEELFPTYQCEVCTEYCHHIDSVCTVLENHKITNVDKSIDFYNTTVPKLFDTMHEYSDHVDRLHLDIDGKYFDLDLGTKRNEEYKKIIDTANMLKDRIEIKSNH